MREAMTWIDDKMRRLKFAVRTIFSSAPYWDHAGWTCFYCGENFGNPNLARAHFGDTQGARAACVLACDRGLVYELREAQKELAQSQLDARRAEERLESADGELHAYQQMAEQAITKLEGRKVTVRSSSDLYMALDSLEGRIVTANAQQRPFFRQLPPCFVTLVLRLHAGLPEAFGLRCDFVKLGAEILEHSEIRSESE